jgi:hypothetical protein
MFAALSWRLRVLESRGTGARRYRNQVVFLAADATRLKELETAARQYLAWHSICEERTQLNLDAQQEAAATTKRQLWLDTVKQRIPETYHWLLVPSLPDHRTPAEQMEWLELKLSGPDHLPVRASKRLKNDGLLVTQYAGTMLRMELDRVPLWKGDHVLVKDLADWFAQYLYLPRLRSTDVLLYAVADGTKSLAWAQDGFAYADRWDAGASRYRGLVAGQLAPAVYNGESVVVKPEAATAQIERDRPPVVEPPPPSDYPVDPGKKGGEVKEPPPQPPSPQSPVVVRQKRFFGSVGIDPRHPARDVSVIATELVARLMALQGADADIRLDITVRVPGGVPQDVERTVRENARVLKFTSAEFDAE